MDHRFKKRTDILTDGAKLIFSDGIKLKKRRLNQPLYNVDIYMILFQRCAWWDVR